MVSHQDLTKLIKTAQECLSLPEDELVAFIKSAAVRAYRAGDDGRKTEDVRAEFNPETKELRLVVKKAVVSEVKDGHKECTEAVGKAPLGQTVDLEVKDGNTYQSIDAAFSALSKLVSAEWKKQNAQAIKAKHQELKQKCVPATVSGSDGLNVIVSLAGEIEALLPKGEQLDEQYATGTEFVVYVKELKEQAGACDLVVSRTDAALVAHAMRRHIPEVDLGNIEVKAVARIASKRSRAAVWSKDFSPTERCAKRAGKVSSELNGEQVEFVEWYAEPKAYIVSALGVAAREVHLLEAEKHALVEVFSDSAKQALDEAGYTIRLAQELTGYKIDVKLVPPDESGSLPGV